VIGTPEAVPLFGGHGLAEYDLDGPNDLARVGNRFVPKEIRVTIDGGHGEPNVHMKIEVRHGVPICTGLLLEGHQGGPEIRDKDVRFVPVTAWVEQIAAACTWAPNIRGIENVQGPAAQKANRANVRAVRVGRPRISREQLMRVAEVYREHIDGSPTDAVRRAFGVSARTAARYVELCRSDEHRLLPKTKPGKKKA
jgi:hypothetical protein